MTATTIYSATAKNPSTWANIKKYPKEYLMMAGVAVGVTGVAYSLFYALSLTVKVGFIFLSVVCKVALDTIKKSRDIIDLRGNVAELQTINANLQRVNQDLRENNDRLHLNVDRFESNNHVLAGNLEQQNRNNRAHEQNNQRQLVQIEGLEEANRNLNQNNNQLHEQIVQFGQETDRLQTEIGSLNAENNRLHEQIETLNGTAARLQTAVEGLEGQRNQLNGEIAHLRGNLDELQGLNGRLMARAGELEQTNARLNGSNALLQAQIAQLTVITGGIEGQLTRFRGNLDQLQGLGQAGGEQLAIFRRNFDQMQEKIQAELGISQQLSAQISQHLVAGQENLIAGIQELRGIISEWQRNGVLEERIRMIENSKRQIHEHEVTLALLAGQSEQANRDLGRVRDDLQGAARELIAEQGRLAAVRAEIQQAVADGRNQLGHEINRLGNVADRLDANVPQNPPWPINAVPLNPLPA